MEQLDKKEQVRKILQWKCKTILEWSVDNKWFDDEFVMDMMSRLESGEDLTSGQINGIHNIYEKFCNKQ